jgi:hypothetical protein
VDRPREDLLQELTRLIGRAVVIKRAVPGGDPISIADRARQVDAVAVIVDSYRGDLDELRRALAPVPVLRSLFERRPGIHAGPPESQFCGYGLLREDGTVEPLPDGALAR